MNERLIPHSRPSLGESEAAAVSDVLRSGRIAQGAYVSKFEHAVAKTTGQAYGAAVSSGTAALQLALAALKIGSGDEVVIPSYTCAALWHAVCAVGARPVLADIDPATYNLSAAAVARSITPRTRAIIAVHSFGLAMDLSELKRDGVAVIEDCAQTLGVTVAGKQAGSRGDLAVCSFYATKFITTGEGGMVLGRSESYMAHVRTLREYDNRDTLEPAFNYKMTDMQAAMGLSQLARLEAFLARRRAIAARYSEAVRKAGLASPEGKDHGYFRFVVRLPKPVVAEAIERAEKLGIACRRPVFLPLHRQLGMTGFPESDAAWAHLLSIPIYPALLDSEVDRIVSALPELLRA